MVWTVFLFRLPKSWASSYHSLQSQLISDQFSFQRLITTTTGYLHILTYLTIRTLFNKKRSTYLCCINWTTRVGMHRFWNSLFLLIPILCEWSDDIVMKNRTLKSRFGLSTLLLKWASLWQAATSHPRCEALLKETCLTNCMALIFLWDSFKLPWGGCFSFSFINKQFAFTSFQSLVHFFSGSASWYACWVQLQKKCFRCTIVRDSEPRSAHCMCDLTNLMLSLCVDVENMNEKMIRVAAGLVIITLLGPFTFVSSQLPEM